MTRSSTIVTLAILSSILTPVVVKATGTTHDSPGAQKARIEAAVVTSTAPVAEASPPCTRRVKVVYAGYGEAHAAACTTTAEIRR